MWFWRRSNRRKTAMVWCCGCTSAKMPGPRPWCGCQEGAQRAYLTNLLEEIQEELPIVDGKVTFMTKPFEIQTVLVESPANCLQKSQKGLAPLCGFLYNGRDVTSHSQPDVCESRK